MNLQDVSHFKQLISLHPLLKSEQQDRITIIISGKQFIVQNRQLKTFPDTLLGNDEKRRVFYDNKSNVYRFDRHPSIFESILYYYLNPGMLMRPPHIESEIFYEELRFWQIDKYHIEAFIDEDMTPLDDIRLLPSEKWRRIIWKTLTYPETIHFPYGELTIGISMSITLLSCIPFMSEIIPTVTELTQFQTILGVEQIHFPLYMRPSYIIEIICIMVFTIELNLRIISAPRFSLILYDICNFLDLIIILSSSICLISYHLHNIGSIDNFLSFYYWLLIIKSFRIYRLARHMSYLRLLYKAIAMCLNELCTLIISVIFCMLLFGTLIYIIDNSQSESNTRNLLDGFWLAFITLTTLGYGDIYPRSFEARLIAGLCALIGIIVFSVNDGVTSRRYTGYPLNSTLVSSYTPDTIRSIINHAAAGQPYSTTVWIRINRVGIQISAQDPQIARTRIPVFIPIGLVHDIYMLPSINNVICIVYDELQSNMKGVLLYVVHPSDAQLLRDDFRIVKQASSTQQTPQQPPYTSPFDKLHPTENAAPVYTPIPSKSPLLYEPYRTNNTAHPRHPSPRRILYTRENETARKPTITPTLLSITHAPYKGSYHSDREDHTHRRHKSPRKHKTVHSPTKRASDTGIKARKYRSRSPEKQAKPKLPVTSTSLELTPEQLQQQQQQQLQLQQQQQQQLLIQQQQQMAAWQANQQMPMIPMGIYNRYVPKTIPLPTGETLKTTLPVAGMTGVAATTNGAAMAFIEPQRATKGASASRSPSRSRSNSPRRNHDHGQNRSVSAQNSSTAQTSRHTTHHHHHHHRRHRPNGNAYVITRGEPNTFDTVSQPSRSRSKYTTMSTVNNNNNSNSSDNDDETKQYLKMLIDEMQAMKLEMNRMRQLAVSAPKGRSDSIHADIKDLRSHIDLIRARIAMTPKVAEK
ncbi:unnamed protein product [Adineta steineri]|uniref:Uncharacterized protein n=1 Tax=Adineta steineri TaxID=433720 RepID=A0A818KX84_9BILA|nr:unnamed protein product [Adineta steineri]CAF3565603.1 unnamed protein product [Adineta steineri]